MFAKRVGLPLIFALFFLSIFLITSNAGGAHPEDVFQLENILPDSTLAFITTGDVSGMMEEMKGTALCKIFNEEEVQDFFADVMKKGEETMKALEGQMGFSLEKLSSFPLGQVGIGYMGMLTFGNAKIPDLIISIDMREGRSHFDGLYKTMLGMMQQKMGEDAFEEGSYRFEERPIRFLEIQQGPTFFFTFLENALVMGTSKGSLEKVVSNFTHGSEEVLSNAPRFSKLKKKLGTGKNSFFFYAVPSQILGHFQGVIPPDVQEKLSYIGVDSVSSVAMSSTALGGGYKDTFYAKLDGKDNFLSNMLACSGKGGIRTLQYVPKDTLFFQSFLLDMSEVWSQTYDMIKQMNPQGFEKMEFGLRKFEEQSGLSMKDDLLGLFGQEFCMYVVLPMSGLIPDVACMIELNQPEKIEGICSGLLQKFGDHLPVKETSYGDFPIRYVESLGLQLPLSPAFAIVDDYLILGGNPQTVKKAIRQFTKKGKNILDNEDFLSLWKTCGLKDASDMTKITYMDLKRGFSFAYNNGVHFLPALLASRKDLPFDFALLPTADSISQHLFGLLSYQRRIENGIFVETFSPIGDPTPMLAIAGLSAFGMARQQAAPPPVTVFPKKVKPEAHTHEEEGDKHAPEAAKPHGFLGVILDQEYKGTGAALESILKSSPAERAGLMPGDVIVNISGNDISSMEELQTVLRNCTVGEEIILAVLRDGKLMRVKAALDRRDRYTAQLENLQEEREKEIEEAREEEGEEHGLEEEEEHTEEVGDLLSKVITLEISDANLGEVFSILSKLSGIRFVVEDDGIRNLSFSGKIEDKQVEWIVDLICNLHSLDYKVEGEGRNMTIRIMNR